MAGRPVPRVARVVLGLGNPGEQYQATRHNVGFRVVEELARRRGVRLAVGECHSRVAAVAEPGLHRPDLRPVGETGEAGGPDEAGGPAGPAGAASVSGLASGSGDSAGAARAVSGPATAGDGTATSGGAATAGHGAAGGRAGGPEPGAGSAGAPDQPSLVLLVQPQTYMNRSGYAARCLAERHGLAPGDFLVVYDEVNLPLGRLRLRRGGSPAGHRGLESILENLRTDEVPRLRLGVAPEAGPPPGADLADFVLSPFAQEETEAAEAMIARAADAVEAWLTRPIEAAMSSFNR